MSTNLESLRARLNKLRTQPGGGNPSGDLGDVHDVVVPRGPQEPANGCPTIPTVAPDQHDQASLQAQDFIPELKGSLLEVTDLPSWMAKIHSNGNRPEDWLNYTNFVRDDVPFPDENSRIEYLSYVYAKAISVIPTQHQKSEAYAYLLVNCALFRGEYSVDVGRSLFGQARRNGKRYAFVHVTAAQFELSQGHPDKCRRILEKSKDSGAEPKELLKVAYRNLINGKTILVSDEERKGMQVPSEDCSPTQNENYAPLEVRPSWGNKHGGPKRDEVENSASTDTGCQHGSNSEEVPKVELLLPKKSWLNASNCSDDSISFERPMAKFPVNRPGVQPEFASSGISPVTPRAPHKPGEISMSVTMSTTAMESTVNFKVPGNLDRNSNACGNHSDDNDTMPSLFDHKRGVYSRTLRNCYSTPDCKSASVLPALSSGRKRFTGMPMRALKSSLPQLNEGEGSESDQEDFPHVPREPAPEMESPHIQDSAEVVSDSSASSQDGDSGIQTTQGSDFMDQLNETESMDCSTPPTPVSQRQDKIDVDTTVPMLDSSDDLLPKLSNLCNSSVNKSQCSVTLKGNISQQDSRTVTHDHSQEFKPSSKQDVSGRVTHSQDVSGRVTHSQDVNGRVTHNQDVSGRVTHSQDVSGRVTHSQGNMPVVNQMHSGNMPGIPHSVAFQASNTGNSGFSHSGQLISMGPGQPSYPVHMQMPYVCTPMKQHEILTINGKYYTVLKMIGKGGTSKVFEVIDADSNLRAVKCVNLECADDGTIRCCRNEIRLLQRLQYSDKVIKMYDHDYNESTSILYVVMERGDTDLATLFGNQRKIGKIDEVTRMYYWKQMLQAVQVLHKEGIVHSDLKPANFLLVAGNLKLIDFGIANAIQSDLTSVTRDQQVGTLNYMSPEAISDTCGGQQVDEHGRVKPRIKIGTKSDVWSLGCILYNMVYLRTPFQSVTNQICKLQAIMNPNYAIDFPEHSDKNLVDVLKKCLIRDPKQRPTIDDLLSHPYLRSIGQSQRHTPKAERPALSITREHLAELVKQLAPVNSPGTVSSISQGLLNQLQSGQAPDVSSFLKRRAPRGAAPPVPDELKPSRASHDGASMKKSNAVTKPPVKHIPRAPLQPLNIPQIQKPS